jgi:hypothetical protein
VMVARSLSSKPLRNCEGQGDFHYRISEIPTVFSVSYTVTSLQFDFLQIIPCPSSSYHNHYLPDMP